MRRAAFGRHTAIARTASSGCRIFSTLLGKRLRTPLGNVYYFGTPEGDERFIHPNLPSFNFPGITGWPALAGGQPWLPRARRRGWEW